MEYTIIGDPKTRAAVIAHLVRLGKVPPVGTSIGFSMQLRHHEIKDPSDISKISGDDGVPVGEKVWYTMVLTKADIDAAHALINDQAISYHEPKTSVMKLDPNDLTT
jgi:hypothetical protein